MGTDKNFQHYRELALTPMALGAYILHPKYKGLLQKLKIKNAKINYSYYL
jgi:hypothetical protein